MKGFSWKDLSGLFIDWHTDRLRNDPTFSMPIGGKDTDMMGGKRPREPGSGSTQWDSGTRRRDNPNTRIKLPTGTDLTTRFNNKNPSVPTEQEEDSSSSEDEDSPFLQKNLGSIMSDMIKRKIEIQYPIYMVKYSEDQWVYSFDPDDSIVESSIYFLANIYINFPKSGLWPIDGISTELQILNKLYRHARIHRVSLDYYTDLNWDETSYDLPMLSLSMTGDKHPNYSNTNVSCSSSNWVYDKNFYFQPINTDKDWGRNGTMYIPQREIQDVDKSAIGSWQYLDTLNTTKFALNLGQGRYSVNGPNDEDRQWCRIGYVSVFLHMYFSTTQGGIVEM